MTRDKEEVVTGSHLRSPRAAAIAGIVFSLLLSTSIVLLHLATTGDAASEPKPADVDLRQVVVALNLVPFVGVAFLWFVGVLRDRLAHQEDRLFATVFLGSAILFLAMLFAGAAVMGSIVMSHVEAPSDVAQSPSYRMARALTSNIVNIYAIKMAAVFMIVTSTVARRTAFVPRWLSYLGFALSLPLLFGSRLIDWGFLVFPGWVLLVSIHILADNLRRRPST